MDSTTKTDERNQNKELRMTTTTITNDTDCADCTAIAVLRTCAGCGAEALITDCGHQSQPRPIAANGIYGTEPSCESCEDAQEAA